MASRKKADDSYSFLLTPEERDLILDLVFGLEPEITMRLRCGAPDGQCLSYQFPRRYVEQLLGAFTWVADHTQDEEICDRFDELSLRMMGVLNGEGMRRPDAEPGSNLPPGMQEAVNRVVDELAGRPIEEIEAAIGELMAAQNSRPQDDLCGLSPEQVYHLIYADWRDPSSSIQLTENIPLAELQGAEILVNARALLDAISAANGVKTTVSGNFNRKFVEQMLETLSCPPELVETLRKYCKVVNESDVMPLMSLHIVLTLAGLIKKTKGAFRITRAGEKLLADAAAGGLVRGAVCDLLQEVQSGVHG
ncbi:MAG: hypothetical protein HZB26_09000 [Candidatus Hydrogenedentes bacterium]|nr:hypothetical protein [Candidatus Hydrogenedentota bacterium]